MSKQLRCGTCNRRISDDEPYYGREIYGTGKETLHHVNPRCARHAFGPLIRGEVTIIHHYHACGDEESGFDCVGGCFLVDVAELVALDKEYSGG